MKHLKSILYLFTLLTVVGIVVPSCSKDEDDDPEPTAPAEFVADNATFADYTSWTVRATVKGADPAVGNSHGSNDTSVTRTIYVKDGATIQGNAFPQGTIIVKVSTNPSGTLKEYTGMVKRGGNFNPDHNGWEWFVLNEDGSIFKDGNNNELRGGKLFDCHSCHSFATTDYVYSKP